MLLACAAAIPVIERTTSDPDFVETWRRRLAHWKRHVWPIRREQTDFAIAVVGGIRDAQAYLDRIWKRGSHRDRNS